MSPQLDLVLQAAMALPETERAELVDSLIATLNTDSPPLSDEWMREIRRRSEEIDAGKVELIPWSVVRARVRSKVFGSE
jgi:putative addiction module component (TIGR02574 family)